VRLPPRGGRRPGARYAVAPRRISLTLPNSSHLDNAEYRKDPGQWAPVTNAVWPSILADPPEQLGLVVEDLPDDIIKREQHG
jgi:hypothetical protein